MRAKSFLQLGKSVTAAIAQVPGGTRLLQEVETIEDTLLVELNSRLQRALSHAAQQRYGSGSASENGAAAATSIDQRFREKLQEGISQRPEKSYEAWADKLLDQITGDEVRIIKAFADDSIHPVLTVRAAFTVTGNTIELLGVYSLINRDVHIKGQELLPVYFAQLVGLGLLEIYPADAKRDLDYKLLEADKSVTQALENARKLGYYRAKSQRHSLRISKLGRIFCDICRADEHATTTS